MNSEKYKCYAFDVGAGLAFGKSEKLIMNSEKYKYDANTVGACIARPHKCKCNANGITLIALIITIIIMLILAGITLNLTLGEHGIFKTAMDAKNKYIAASEDEEKALQDLYKELGIENLPENTKEHPQDAGKEVALKDGWGKEAVTYTNTKNGLEVTGLTKIATVYAVSVGNGDTVPVPKGFYYVGGTLDTGVVISDNEADKNKYVGIEDVPAGVAYNEDGTVNADKSELKGNQFVWIPVSASEYVKKDFRKSK